MASARRIVAARHASWKVIASVGTLAGVALLMALVLRQLRKRELAEQHLRVLSNDEVRQQRDALAERGQVVEGAHRHVELIADAVYIEDDLRHTPTDVAVIGTPSEAAQAIADARQLAQALAPLEHRGDFALQAAEQASSPLT